MKSATDKVDDRTMAENSRPSSMPVVELRNLGPKSAALLRTAGCEDLDALRRAGAVPVYGGYRPLRPDG